LNAAEKEVFDMLRLEVSYMGLKDFITYLCTQVIERSDELRQNAHIIDELDISISFANLAEEMNFVRPEIVEE
jgi:DNA mismatch repair ATPase MutS